MKKNFKLSIITLILMALILIGCSDETENATYPNGEDTPYSDIVESYPTDEIEPSEGEEEWNFVTELSGEVDRLESDIFTLQGTEVKIIYDIIAEEVSGNALIYILEEGATLSQNAAGELEIASHDRLVVGTNTGEIIVEKYPGSHYLLVNSSSLESFTVRIYERP